MASTPTPTPAPAAELRARESAILKRYWQSNIRIMGILLLVWAFVSLGCGIWFADILNPFELPGTGYPLGFWFAQQGSIVVFVGLILVYALLMNRLDRRHHEERAALDPGTRDEDNYRAEGI